QTCALPISRPDSTALRSRLDGTQVATRRDPERDSPGTVGVIPQRLPQTPQVPSAHPSTPPAGVTTCSGWASAHAFSSTCSSASGGWAPATPYVRSTTKNGTAVIP